MTTIFLIAIIFFLVHLSVQVEARYFPEFDPDLHSPQHPPKGWIQQPESEYPIDRSMYIRLNIALSKTDKQNDDLEKLFWDISTPKSPKYRKHSSQQELRSIVGNPKSANQVTLYITRYHSPSMIDVSPTQDWVHVSLPISDAEKFLSTKYSWFTNKDYPHPVLRSVSPFYSVDADLKDHISMVGGSFRFPMARPNFQSDETPVLSTKLKQSTPEAATSNTPIISGIPGTNQMFLFAVPLCKDFNITLSATNPCSDHPPEITSFKTIFTPVSYGSQGTLQEDIITQTKPISSCSNYQNLASSAKPRCSAMLSSIGINVSTSPNAVCCIFKHSALDSISNQRIAVQSQSIYNDSSKSLLQNPFGKPHTSQTSLILFSNLLQFTKPHDIFKLYHVPSGLRATTSSKTSQAVSEFLGQYIDLKDSYDFYELMGLPRLPDPLFKGNGNNNPLLPGGEASLDIQWIMINQCPHTEFWVYDTLHEQQEPFLTWVTQVNDANSPPQVFSTSYADPADSLTSTYRSQLDNEFKKAGARGITLLFSAGDDGSLGYECRNDHGCCTNPSQKMGPEFPPTSPYVTAIGGTNYGVQSVRNDFTLNQYGIRQGPLWSSFSPTGGIGDGGNNEVACSIDNGARITTGGGFSFNYGTPSYQKSFVDQYLSAPNITFPPETMWNKHGRGYPDISALAHNFPTVIGGEIIPVDGTSASAPTVGMLITLLNDQLASQDGSDFTPLGFLNPLLYEIAASHGEAFNSIKVGNNGCTAVVCCEDPDTKGFSAASSQWNAVSGLGSLNWLLLRDIILQDYSANPNPKSSNVTHEINSLQKQVDDWMAVSIVFIVINVLFIIGLSIHYYQNKQNRDYTPIPMVT